MQTTADGIFIVRHSYTLSDGRWTHLVHLSELAQLAADYRPIQLSEVLSWAVAKNTMLVLDVKSGFRDPHQTHAALGSILRKRQLLDQVMVADWDHLALYRSKAAVSGLMIRAALGARLADLQHALAATRPDVISFPWDLVRPEDVEVAHTMGVAVSLIKGWHEEYFNVARRCDVDVVSWDDVAAARSLLAGS